MIDPTLVSADTIADAYTKLKGLFEASPSGAEIYNLTVHVRNPDFSIPRGYSLSESEVRVLAEKWQSRMLPTDGSLYFTHGQRIYAYGSQYDRTIDQFEYVVKLLARAPRRRRAVISLLDPTIDTIRPHDAPIPSFNIAQFFVSDQYLHLTAYFKAQELSRFWIVNMYEMLLLLEKAIDRLRDEAHIKYQRGTITTHATQAYWDTGFTLLERPLLERNQDKLFVMLYDVFIQRRVDETETLIAYLNDAVRGHSHVELTGFEKMYAACRDLENTVIKDERDTNKKDKYRHEVSDFMNQVESMRKGFDELRSYLADRDPESEKVLGRLRQQVIGHVPGCVLL